MIRTDLIRELHLALKITLAMAILAEAFALTGIIPGPHDALLRWFTPPVNYFTFGSLFVHFFILRFFCRPTWREGGQVLAITAVFLLACFATDFAADVPLSYLITTPAAAFGLTSLGAFVRAMRRGAAGEQIRNQTLLIACGVLLAMHITADSFLSLTSALRPATYDHAAYIIDGTLGFQPSILLANIFAAHPWLDYLGTMSYFFIAYGFSALFGLQLARPEKVSANIIKFIVLCFSSVFFVYLLCPVAGPEYAFGANFPNAMPASAELSAAPAVIPGAPRNGVPSMHVGWALGMFVNALPFTWPVRMLFGGLLLLNILSTLGLGEHYFIDLVLSFPFILAVQTLCLGPRAIGRTNYRAAIGFGIGATALWLTVILGAAPLLAAVPGLTWLAVILTVGGSWWYARPLLGVTRSAPEAPGADGVVVAPRLPRSWSVPEFSAALLFFVSGFAALIYQVLFSKALSYTFGSAATATFTVLATYMGGMAMGAWIGGRVAARRSDPLRIYAMCELGIALYCIATPAIFSAVQSAYVALAAGTRPDEVSLLVLRFLLGVAVLLPPTMLMGMTLPVLVRQLLKAGDLPGIPLAALYSSNTVGAAFGALLSGYLIIPALGMTNSVRLAAWLNILVAGAAYIIFTRHVLPGAVTETIAPAAAGLPPRPAAIGIGRMALLILALGGVVSLGLEVAYVHVLAIVAGNSVYAFALMLFVFLLALGSGSEVARRLLLKNWGPPLLVCLAQTGVALSIVCGIFLWANLPGYFATFQNYPSAATFSAREFIRGVVCFIGMFPAAFCIGLSYAPCLQLVAAGSTRSIQSVGAAIALNTAGNILGVLLVGFVLLPKLGALPTLHLLAAVSALLGVCLIAALAPRQRVMFGGGVATILLLIVLQPHRFDYDRLATGANVYFGNTYWGRVIDHAESMDGGLTSVHVSPATEAGHEVKTLLTNGKFQGNNSTAGEMVAQTAFGLLPLLHTPARADALVIGYGTGTTARVLNDAGFARLDMVDLSRDVFVLANRHFASVNGGVATRAGVQSYVTDGRNFLLLGKKHYDIICVELSSIWFAGAAALYNREFYALARSRLGQSGVLQQWIQLHHMQPLNVAYMLGSVRAEFQYVWLYLAGDQGIIVASNDPLRQPRAENAQKMDATEQMRALMPPDAESFAALQDKVLLDPDDVDRLLSEFKGSIGVPISTDENAVLEYSTPKGNVLDFAASLHGNINILVRFQGTNTSPAPPGVQPAPIPGN